MATRMPIMATTVMSSSSVKPASPARRLPITVFRPVQALALALGIDVVHVAAAPGVAVRVVLVAAQPPHRALGHRVQGDAPQELQLLLLDRADRLDALDQDLERGRI